MAATWKVWSRLSLPQAIAKSYPRTGAAFNPNSQVPPERLEDDTFRSAPCFYRNHHICHPHHHRLRRDGLPRCLLIFSMTWQQHHQHKWEREHFISTITKAKKGFKTMLDLASHTIPIFGIVVLAVLYAPI